MKVSILIAGAVLGWAGAAQAQAIVTGNVGLAHDCFVFAMTGHDPRSGVDVCTQAIQREALNRKNFAATYDNRGVMRDALGHTDTAAEDFNMAITLQPDLGDPYVNLGSMLIKKRQYGEALVQINKGLDLGMGFPHIGYYDRAVAEEMMGRYKESYYDYKKALEIAPDYGVAAERLKDFVVTSSPAKGPG